MTLKEIVEKINGINTLYGIVAGMILTVLSISFHVGARSYALNNFIEESNKNSLYRNIEMNAVLVKQLEKVERDPGDLKQSDINKIQDYKKYELLSDTQLAIANYVVEKTKEQKEKRDVYNGDIKRNN